jgi:hypothetical protein
MCPSKSMSEKEWIARRSRCRFPASTNSSQCHKSNAMAYARRPPVVSHSPWRSFAASLNLEDGALAPDSTSSSSEQASDADGVANADASENLLPRRLTSDEVLAELSVTSSHLCSSQL